jgi:hypothetical protein
MFAPVTRMDLIVRVPLPVFIKVETCGALVIPTVWSLKFKFGGDRFTAGCVPVPESAAVWGLPAPLSVIVSVPFCKPTFLGLKVTLIRHFPPAGSSVPQLLVWLNSALVVIEVILSLPLVLSWTIFGGLVVSTGCAPKSRLEGIRVTIGAVPMPVSGTVCGLLGALSVMETSALRLPRCVGVKVTEMLQLWPAGSDLPQLFFSEKSP